MKIRDEKLDYESTIIWEVIYTKWENKLCDTMHVKKLATCIVRKNITLQERNRYREEGKNEQND